MTVSNFLRRRLASFRYAMAGIGCLFRTQFHAWLHLVATIVVVCGGFLMSVTSTEWCLLILAIGLVWTAEAMNTAIEFTVDLASPEYQKLAGQAKDVAAGAVLLAAITAAVIGLIVFVPRVL